MRFSKLVVQTQRLRSGGQDSVDPRFQMVVQEQERIAICDAGVSACIERIQSYRVGEHPAGQLVVRFRVSLHKLAAAEIKRVRFDVGCRRLRNGLLFLRQQLDDRKSTRLNSSHMSISYAVFCLKKK